MPFTWLLNWAFFAGWLIVGFVVLRLAAGRYFHERRRANVAALAAVAAFAVGTTFPYTSRIGGAPTDFVPTVLTSTPAPGPSPIPLRDVSHRCVAGTPVKGAGVGSLDGLTDSAGGALAQGQTLERGEQFSAVGWAADHTQEKPAVAVCLIVDGTMFRNATTLYGGARADVAAALHRPGLLSTQFAVTVRPGVLRPGPHVIQAAVLSADGTWGFIGVPHRLTLQ